MTPTEQRIAEIKARAEAATEGPWDWEASDYSLLALGTAGTALFEGHVLSSHRCKACADRDAKCLWPTQENGAFIAHARVDIPWLLERLERAEAEVERLRTLVDAIVTGDGEARGIGEGLRQAAVFVKGWCRCSEAFASRGLRDPGCQACDLADELEGQADEILLSAVEKQARDRGALERAIAHHEAEAEREAITSPVRAGLHRQLVELYRKSLAALEAPDGS